MKFAIPIVALLLASLAGDVAGSEVDATVGIALVAGLLAGLAIARLGSRLKAVPRSSVGSVRERRIARLYRKWRVTSRRQLLLVWGSVAVFSYGLIWALPGTHGIPSYYGLLSFFFMGAILFVVLAVLSWSHVYRQTGSLAGAAWMTCALVFLGGLAFTGGEIVVQWKVRMGDQGLAARAASGPSADAPEPGTGTDSNSEGELGESIKLTPGRINPSRAMSVAERVADASITIRFYRGHGSAFLITRDGLALTNYHVVKHGPPLRARFRDGSERPAEIVRAVPDADVALIRIACEPDCHTVELETSEGASIGQDVLVIGTPGLVDLQGTATRGIVSALRTEDDLRVIQTDAAINRGNSGGPIVDAGSGRVIGIVTSSFIERGAQGLNFGVDIRDALRAVGIEYEF